MTARTDHAEIVEIKADLSEIKALLKAMSPAKVTAPKAVTVRRSPAGGFEVAVAPAAPKAPSSRKAKTPKVMTRKALKALKAAGKVPYLVTCKQAVLLPAFKGWVLPSGEMSAAIKAATEAKAAKK